MHGRIGAQVRPINPGETVLVTGGCGFIGANLVRELLRGGYRVRVVDDFSHGRRDYVAGLPIEVVVGDICDSATAKTVVAGCAGVVHLAAIASVLDSVRNPMPGLRTNIEGTVELLFAAVAHGVKRFIFASSNAAVGPQDPPIGEAALPRPASPYGASKLAGEGYCAAFHASYGLSTLALRFSNAYGPFSRHKTSVIAKLLRRIIANESITVYGDGLQTRDFIFAADVARAIRLSLQSPSTGVLQIGTGVETSIRDLIQILEEVASTKVVIDWLPQPEGEVRRNFAATGRAAESLGFSAEVGLRDGLAITYDWLRRIPISGPAS